MSEIDRDDDLADREAERAFGRCGEARVGGPSDALDPLPGQVPEAVQRASQQPRDLHL